MKKVMVISLGGSLIVPEEIDMEFLIKFKKILEKNKKNFNFVVVCGGGSIARKYISALKKEGKSEYFQSLAGIAITRVNARFMTYLFGEDANEGIPHDMKHVASLLKKHDIVFCGALRYHSAETSDSTAARLAAFFKTDFINLTNVQGLYNKNPLEYKNAKFIPQISREELANRVQKIKFKPGQHFVIDQKAMNLISENKIPFYILGKDLRQFENLLNGKPFIGTTVC